MTAGEGASSPARRFSTIVAGALGWQEVNLGRPASPVTGRDADGQVTDEDSGLGRVPDVLDTEPDRVIILYGDEDFRLSRPLGNTETFQQGTFTWDFDTLLRGLMLVLAPDAVTVVTLPRLPGAEQPNALGLIVPDYNDRMAWAARREGARLLDAWANSGITADNLHQNYHELGLLNDPGHECLAAFLLETLRP